MSDSESGYDLDWSGSSEEMVRQILHQGELRLAGQLQLAIAADQRATTSASIFVGFAAAIFAAAVAYGGAVDTDTSVAVAAAVLVLGLLMGAICCFYAARPRNFYTPGSSPEDWFPVRNGNLVIALGGEAENYAANVADNAHVLEGHAVCYTVGVAIAVASPLLGWLTWLILSCPVSGA